MKPVWYNISNPPRRIHALYDDDKIDEPSEVCLLGVIEKMKNGSWFWRVHDFFGNEPTKNYAAEQVEKYANGKDGE